MCAAEVCWGLNHRRYSELAVSLGEQAQLFALGHERLQRALHEVGLLPQLGLLGIDLRHLGLLLGHLQSWQLVGVRCQVSRATL